MTPEPAPETLESALYKRLENLRKDAGLGAREARKLLASYLVPSALLPLTETSSSPKIAEEIQALCRELECSLPKDDESGTASLKKWLDGVTTQAASDPIPVVGRVLPTSDGGLHAGALKVREIDTIPLNRFIEKNCLTLGFPTITKGGTDPHATLYLLRLWVLSSDTDTHVPRAFIDTACPTNDNTANGESADFTFVGGLVRAIRDSGILGMNRDIFLEVLTPDRSTIIPTTFPSHKKSLSGSSIYAACYFACHALKRTLNGDRTGIVFDRFDGLEFPKSTGMNCPFVLSGDVRGDMPEEIISQKRMATPGRSSIHTIFVTSRALLIYHVNSDDPVTWSIGGDSSSQFPDKIEEFFCSVAKYRHSVHEATAEWITHWSPNIKRTMGAYYVEPIVRRPSTSDVFETGSVDRILESIVECDIVLIEAPSGYGKSRLLKRLAFAMTSPPKGFVQRPFVPAFYRCDFGSNSTGDDPISDIWGASRWIKNRVTEWEGKPLLPLAFRLNQLPPHYQPVVLLDDFHRLEQGEIQRFSKTYASGGRRLKLLISSQSGRGSLDRIRQWFQNISFHHYLLDEFDSDKTSTLCKRYKSGADLIPPGLPRTPLLIEVYCQARDDGETVGAVGLSRIRLVQKLVELRVAVGRSESTDATSFEWSCPHCGGGITPDSSLGGGQVALRRLFSNSATIFADFALLTYASALLAPDVKYMQPKAGRRVFPQFRFLRVRKPAISFSWQHAESLAMFSINRYQGWAREESRFSALGSELLLREWWSAGLLSAEANEAKRWTEAQFEHPMFQECLAAYALTGHCRHSPNLVLRFLSEVAWAPSWYNVIELVCEDWLLANEWGARSEYNGKTVGQRLFDMLIERLSSRLDEHGDRLALVSRLFRLRERLAGRGGVGRRGVRASDEWDRGVGVGFFGDQEGGWGWSPT